MVLLEKAGRVTPETGLKPEKVNSLEHQCKTKQAKLELTFLEKPGAKSCINQEHLFMILLAYRERWSRPNTPKILWGIRITEFLSCIGKNIESH